MKIIITLFTLVISAVMSYAQNTIYLTVDGVSRSVTLADNNAAKGLKDMLNDGPVTIRMSDYGGFEKVGPLPQSLPASNAQITTQPGDIMLYQGSQMVIFYGTNSWSYTRLGHIDGATATNVKEFLGNGPVDVIVSLTAPAGLDEVKVDADTDAVVFDLTGRPVMSRPLAPGAYIINGKKIIVR